MTKENKNPSAATEGEPKIRVTILGTIARYGSDNTAVPNYGGYTVGFLKEIPEAEKEMLKNVIMSLKLVNDR